MLLGLGCFFSSWKTLQHFYSFSLLSNSYSFANISASDRKKEAFIIVNSVKRKIFCLLISAPNKVFSLFIDRCTHCVSLKKKCACCSNKGKHRRSLNRPSPYRRVDHVQRQNSRALLNAKHPQ